MITRWRRYCRLYLVFVGLRVRTFIEYRGDTALLAVSAALSDGLGLVFFSVIYEQVPVISGWSRPQAMLVYGLVVLSGGVTQLFFDGLWTLGSAVWEGRLDLFLSRPQPPLLSLLTFWMSPEGIGGVVLGGALCGWALHQLGPRPSFLGAVVAVLLVLSGIGLRVGLTLIVNCVRFWANGPLASGFGDISEPLYELGRYPLGVYPKVVRLLLTTAVPIAFVGVVPASYLAGRPVHPGLVVAAPLVAAASWMIGLSLFRLGVWQYDSPSG